LAAFIFGCCIAALVLWDAVPLLFMLVIVYLIAKAFPDI
jgi:hypothetical protein